MLWRAVYALATWLALPFALGYFCWRGAREPAYRRHWHERLGYGRALADRPIWVHAASVGEVALVAPLVEALRQRYPRIPLLLTTMTPTGRERVRARFGAWVCHRYLPLDTRGATRRFMVATRPRLAVFAETELWPNLIGAAAARHVPIVIVNASLSARSAARYARWPLAHAGRFMLGAIAAIGATDARHAERFRALGARPGRVRVTGDLKYDTGDTSADLAAGRALRAACGGESRPIWTAASTHAGEERLIVQAYAEVRRAHPATLLVIAPRHPQRFDAVHADLLRSGWAVARRSAGAPVRGATDILLADTVGEVRLFYAASDVVFVGGSLVPGIGGHNVLEAAALARVLCVGPYIGEWRQAIDALRARHAAHVCEDAPALARQVRRWLDDRAAAADAGRAGAAVVRANRGALARTLGLIQAVLGRAGVA